MPAELIAWLVVGFLALVVLHELTHVAVASWHGHPTVCVAINPIGVAVVFEDCPRPRYWLAQVILPAAVSWAVCYIWLYGTVTYPSALSTRVSVQDMVAYLPAVVTLITLLTSGGDVVSALVEVRQPVWGDQRIMRGFRLLRKIPNVILFTAHGRQRWQAVWVEGKQNTGPVPLTTG